MCNHFLTLCLIAFSCIAQVVHSSFNNKLSRVANETELQSMIALQTYPSSSLKELSIAMQKNVENSVKIRAVKTKFAQQNGVYPETGKLQLDNFGALYPWSDILKSLTGKRKLLVMIRHAQAYENLNPTANSNCEFELNGETIPNFDSPLSPNGRDQANSLNSLLKSPSSSSQNVQDTTTSTWFETMGLTRNGTLFVTSPLSRTMQTSQIVLDALPVTGSVAVSELIRAAIGTDVCNFRRNVYTPTSSNPLPAPFTTGCKDVPTDSLTQIYADSKVKFSFTVRPAGSSSSPFGLVSDNDQLWRSDFSDKNIMKTRVLAFLDQIVSLPESENESNIICIVTHGETVRAIYEAVGENSYTPYNTEVVPIIIEPFI